MNSQLLLLLAVLMPGAVVQAPPEPAPEVAPPAAPDTTPGLVAAADAPVVAAAGDPATLLEGRRLFVRYQCAACHGNHARGGMASSLRDTAWTYGGAPSDVFTSIADGRSQGMPAWGNILPPEEIWKLVAYIGSLRAAQLGTNRDAALPVRVHGTTSPGSS